MTIKLYKNPKKVGWLGWIEGKNNMVVGFVCLNGQIQIGW